MCSQWMGTPTSSSKSRRETTPSASTSMKTQAQCCASFRTPSQVGAAGRSRGQALTLPIMHRLYVQLTPCGATGSPSPRDPVVLERRLGVRGPRRSLCLGNSFALNTTPWPRQGAGLQLGSSAARGTQECLGTGRVGSEVLVSSWGSHAVQVWLEEKVHPKNQPGLRKVSVAPHYPVPLAGLTVNGQIIGEKGGNSDSKTRKTYFGKLGIASAHMDFRMEVTPEKITLWSGAAQSTFSWLDTVTVTQDGYSPAPGSQRSKEPL